MVDHTVLFELSEKAKSFGINPDRPFFPVNSLRLLYFMVLEELTHTPATIERLNEAVPQIEAVLAARMNNKIGTHFRPQQDYTRALGPLQDLQGTFYTPALDTLFNQLFGVALPYQDGQLSFLISQSGSIKHLSPQVLLSILQSRCIDSLVYSTYILELFRKTRSSSSEGPQRDQDLALYLHASIFLSCQMNDLVDMVVFAKDDVGTNTFTPLSLLQQNVTDPQILRSLIDETADVLLKQLQDLTFDHPIQHIFIKYNTVLASVIR